jgi:hypothetical protein
VFIIVDLFIIIVFVLIVVWFVKNVSTDFKARSMERDMITALINAGMKKTTQWPELIYRRHRKIDGVSVTVLEFFSLGFGLELWKKHQEAILSAWTSHLTTDIVNGGKHQEKGNYIILHTRPGVKPKPRPAPTDPLFK